MFATLIISLIAMVEKANKEGDYCKVAIEHQIKLGEIVELIQSFKDSRTTFLVPDLSNPFTKKLYSTYLSYLPENSFSYPLKMNVDERGSFTEFLKSPDRGQVSINISWGLSISFAVYTILLSWSGLYSQFLNGIGKVKLQMNIAIAQCLLTIPVSLLFAQYFGLGIIGVVVALNINLLISSILLPIQVNRIINDVNSGVWNK